MLLLHTFIEFQEIDILLHRSLAVAIQYGHDYLEFSFYFILFKVFPFPVCLRGPYLYTKVENYVREEKKRVLNVL